MSDEHWPALLKALAAVLPKPVHVHLSFCTGRLEGERFVIRIPDDMTAMMVDKGPVREAIQKAIDEKIGGGVRLQMGINEPEKAGGKPLMDALARMKDSGVPVEIHK